MTRAHLADPVLYRAFYDADMHPGWVPRMPPQEPRAAWVRARLGRRDDVVDLGCHKGEMTGLLPLWTLGRVVGVDIAAGALADAARHWGATAHGRRIGWICADAARVPLASGSADAVILAEILEHVADVAAVVAEAERLVRSGGRVLVSVPIDALAIDAFDRVARVASLGFDLDMHVREVDPAALFAGRRDLEVAEEWADLGPRADGGPERFGFRLASYRVGGALVLVRTITACRACQDPKLEPVLDLGNLAISDFLTPGQEVERAPLCLVRCASCGLVQLRHTVHRDRLYTQYHYRSGVNQVMVDALYDVVIDALERVDLEPGDAVLDIGCNDGTLLRNYPDWTVKIGVDPSDVATEAWLDHPHDYTLIRDYFPVRRQHTPVRCKIVTCIAAFYDLDDPGAFLEEVKRWLHPEGVLVLQFQDVWSMVDANAVDNICHEHLCYYSGETLTRLARAHGLHVVGDSYHDINGGSLRVFLAHGPGRLNWVSPPTDWHAFADRVERNKTDALVLLHRLKHEGASVYGMAASTKWNTLSQFYGIGPDLIAAIGERSPAKWGTTTVTGIPIVSEQAMRDARPDYLVCCAWQFADAFAEREAALLAQGTRLIVPLPVLRVVEREAAGARL